MTRRERLLIARAINKCKKVDPKIMFGQMPLEIGVAILKKDRNFDYHEFFEVCNK
jgi:hypothetical protein